MIYNPTTGGVSLDPRETATGEIVAFHLSSNRDVVRAGNGFRTQDALLPFAAGATDTDLQAFQLAQVDWSLDGFSEVWNLGNILKPGLSSESLGDVILKSGYASGLGHGGTFRLAVVLDAGSLPGDYNANGIVEQGDLDLVLLNWGSDVNAPPGLGQPAASGRHRGPGGTGWRPTSIGAAQPPQSPPWRPFRSRAGWCSGSSLLPSFCRLQDAGPTIGSCSKTDKPAPETCALARN